MFPTDPVQLPLLPLPLIFPSSMPTTCTTITSVSSPKSRPNSLTTQKSSGLLVHPCKGVISRASTFLAAQARERNRRSFGMGASMQGNGFLPRPPNTSHTNCSTIMLTRPRSRLWWMRTTFMCFLLSTRMVQTCLSLITLLIIDSTFQVSYIPKPLTGTGARTDKLLLLDRHASAVI